MRGPAVQPIVIAAGGTGGHFFPAEALAATLIERGHRIVLMSDARSSTLRSAVFAGQDHYMLQGAGLAGRGTVRAARALAALATGTLQARTLLKAIDAAAIVGFGGYPSVPPILAARFLRRRPLVVLQEQNAVLGRANRLLSRRADLLALGFENTAGIPNGVTQIVTGNPVRLAIQALSTHAYTLPGDMISLLIFGGSLGARIFSDVVPAALAALPANTRSRLRVTQQCRTEDISRVRHVYDASFIIADLAPFFEDIADRLAQAHLVVARAGASTCAEIAVAGRPSILVPLPTAIDDHQTANAAALAQSGGAQLIPQSDFSPVHLTKMLFDLLIDPTRLQAQAKAATTCGHPQAAAALADALEHRIALRAVS